MCFSCWTFIFSCKEVDGPYAWRGVLKFQRDYCGHSGDGLVDGDDSQKTIDTPMDDGPPDFQTSLQHLIAQASAISSIHFALPKSNAVAGAVLAHAIKIVEKQFSQHDPMIFKLGFTHNPHWRWCNPRFMGMVMMLRNGLPWWYFMRLLNHSALQCLKLHWLKNIKVL